MGGRGSLRGRVGIRGGVHRQCFGRFKIRNGDENECLEVFWFHVQGFSIFPHGQNEEKEKNDEKGVSVKNWPLGGKVEMILCHLEEERLCTSLLHLSTYHFIFTTITILMTIKMILCHLEEESHHLAHHSSNLEHHSTCQHIIPSSHYHHLMCHGLSSAPVNILRY